MDGYGVTVENSSGLRNFLSMFSKKDSPVEIDINNTHRRREIIIKPRKDIIVTDPIKPTEEESDEEPISPEQESTLKPFIIKAPQYCAYSFDVKGQDILLTCPENLPLCNGYNIETNELGSCAAKPTVIPKTIFER